MLSFTMGCVTINSICSLCWANIKDSHHVSSYKTFLSALYSVTVIAGCLWPYKGVPGKSFVSLLMWVRLVDFLQGCPPVSSMNETHESLTLHNGTGARLLRVIFKYCQCWYIATLLKHDNDISLFEYHNYRQYRYITTPLVNTNGW